MNKRSEPCKSCFVVVLLFLTLLLLNNVGAVENKSTSSFAGGIIEEITIEDDLGADGDVREKLVLKLINVSSDEVTLGLPAGAEEVRINGEESTSEFGVYTVPLNCSTCYIMVSYTLRSVVKEEKDALVFSRIISFPSPRVFQYTVLLPKGSLIRGGEGVSIVPQGAVGSDGQRIFVTWSEREPEFPKAYLVWLEKRTAPSSWPGLVAGVLALFFVFVVAALLFFVFSKKSKDAERVRRATKTVVIPHTVFSPDEKAVVRVLKQQRAKARALLKTKNTPPLMQKELCKLLSWSKSKVSGVVSSLERKGIVQRERVGRSFRVVLVHDIDLPEQETTNKS
ncbi:hypothetical protein D6783_04470 [Candidatus Woesearchaeota archaeon]|nr:MAG: hypothetical protein D6783_04470 [Candidatus Woesearchaeota archaeon]